MDGWPTNDHVAELIAKPRHSAQGRVTFRSLLLPPPGRSAFFEALHSAVTACSLGTPPPPRWRSSVTTFLPEPVVASEPLRPPENYAMLLNCSARLV